MRCYLVGTRLHHLHATHASHLEFTDKQAPEDRIVCHLWRGLDNMYLRYPANVLRHEVILL
jgi:hypothetical protein